MKRLGQVLARRRALYVILSALAVASLLWWQRPTPLPTGEALINALPPAVGTLRSSDSLRHPRGFREGRFQAAPAQAVPTQESTVRQGLTAAWPIKGPILVGYGWSYNPALMEWRFHDGFDLGGTLGQVVHAAFAGRVVSSRALPGVGQALGILSANGIESIYTGLGSPLVRLGQQVSVGAPLGVLAASGFGEAAEGPHLHFVVLLDGAPVAPGPYLTPH